MARTTRLVGLVFVGLAAVTLGITSCQDGASATLIASDVVVSELTTRYQARVGGEEVFTYTVEAQAQWITGKPTLFRVMVDDVFVRNGQTLVRFSSHFLSPVDYVLELECSEPIVATILARGLSDPTDRYFDEYAVVANIEEVSKAVIALDAWAYSERSGEDEWHIVEINPEPSRLFIARGTCVDIAYIP